MEYKPNVDIFCSMSPDKQFKLGKKIKRICSNENLKLESNNNDKSSFNNHTRSLSVFGNSSASMNDILNLSNPKVYDNQ